MRELNNYQKQGISIAGDTGNLFMLVSALVLMSAVLFALLMIFVDFENLPFQITRVYLIPWVLAAGLVIIAPSIYLMYRNEFSFTHPLVFATFTYYFPGVFIGGLLLASGIVEPYYTTFIQDERYNLPLTMAYITLGYAGLSIGCLMPLGQYLGKKLGSRLPVWNWKPERVLLPGILLFGIGIVTTVAAFSQGIIGNQESTDTSSYYGLLQISTYLLLEATFILWLCIFKLKNLNITHYAIMFILIITTLARAAFQGNRGSLPAAVYVVAIAFIFSGRVVKTRHWVTTGSLIAIALVVGMIYGTTFRNLMTADRQLGADRYSEMIGNTVLQISGQDLTTTLEISFLTLAERVESVSSVAVVVSTYEQLLPYEESYGLENNIIKESSTFFIPRVIWPNKPTPSDYSKYSDLYFNFSGSSFAITPIGDLLRNFGPFGIPIGMLLIGLIIRIAYVSLRETQEFSFWKSTLYFMILVTISYEGFFATIIPFLVKMSILSLLGIMFVGLFARDPQPANI